MSIFQHITNNYSGVNQDKMMKYKQILNEEKAEEAEFKNEKKHHGEYDYYTDDYDTFVNSNNTYKATTKVNNYLNEDDYNSFNSIKVVEEEEDYNDYEVEEDIYDDNDLYMMFNTGYKWFVVISTLLSIVVVLYLLFTLKFIYIFLYMLILLICFMLGYILMFVLNYFIN